MEKKQQKIKNKKNKIAKKKKDSVVSITASLTKLTLREFLLHI